MSKVIYLITTYKCSACKFQKDILEEVLEEYKDIELKVIDCSEVPEWIRTNIILTDFPTTIFIKDGIIKYHFVGTKANRKIKALIKDINF